MKSNTEKQQGGYGFGTFQGVFTPSILTIIGVVMYLRFGWVLGNVGLTGSLALVTIGVPENDHFSAFAKAVLTSARERRNVLIVRQGETPPEDGYLDVWWRGGGNNGALMLSLAVLLRRDDFWKRHPLRINMLVHSRTPEEAGRQLNDFLFQARIKAKTRILETDGQPFTRVLTQNSTDAAMTFVGLRPPCDDETAASYGNYLEHLTHELSDVPAPIYVMSANGIDLSCIFT